jgi:hypothetical protein
MTSDTVMRSLHDLGLAVWFGGAVATATTPRSPGGRDGDDGMSRMVPTVAIAAHAVGGIGLILANRDRHRRQRGVLTVTLVKAALTGAAIGASAYSAKVSGELRRADAAAAGRASSQHDADTAGLRTRARALEVAVPVLTGALVVLGAEEGELQRPSRVARGVAAGTGARLGDGISTAAAHARDAIIDRIHDIDTERIGDAVSDLRDAVTEKLPGQ